MHVAMPVWYCYPDDLVSFDIVLMKRWYCTEYFLELLNKDHTRLKYAYENCLARSMKRLCWTLIDLKL